MKNFKLHESAYTKTAFSASDFGKPSLDIYFGLRNIPRTNPSKWTDHLRMGAGRGAEEVLLSVLKDSRVVEESYDQDWDGRVDMDRHGVVVHGYMDAVTSPYVGLGRKSLVSGRPESNERILLPVDDSGDGYGNDNVLSNQLNLDYEPNAPIEIKTINNNNRFDIRDYIAGKPKENYVGQLSVYMDFLDSPVGYLFAATIDGKYPFWFKCLKIAPGLYQCGEVVVNVNLEYQRWSRIQKMILDKKMPDIFEYRYKYPLDTIDWSKISAATIANVRAGRKVIGDWQITYSPWKDLIVKLQGETLGYTKEEMELIKQVTAGYSTRNKK